MNCCLSTKGQNKKALNKSGIAFRLVEGGATFSIRLSNH